MDTTALVPRRSFPLVDDEAGISFLPRAMQPFSENPLAVIARQDPNLAARLIDTLSARQNETGRFLGFLHASADVARSHCMTLAQAVANRPDMDHFRIATKSGSGRSGLFFDSDRRFSWTTTQLDMW